MTAQQLLHVIAARWWVFVLVMGTMVATTAGVTQLLPRLYTATTTVVIEPKSSEVLAANVAASPMMAQTLMATQLDVITSERVALRVVGMMGFEGSETARQQWRKDTEGVGSMKQYFAAALLKRLEVRPSRDSAVVAVNFTGSDPGFAADVANAFAKAYIETNLELRTQPALQSAKWFDEQLKKLRENVEQAQARLSAYQQQKGIVFNDERAETESARLFELTQQLSLAQSATLDARSRFAQSTPSPDSVPDVANSPVVQGLRSDLARGEVKLQEVAQHFGPEHPTFIRMRTEMEALRERLALEMKHSTGTLHAVSHVNTQREAALAAAVAVQKRRVLASKQQRDEMTALVREADNAQRIYDSALQRLSMTRLEAQSDQSNAYVLTAATPPTEASSPKTRVYLGLSIGIGFLLGLASTVLVESVDRRVRCEADVESALKLPCMGSVPAQRAPPMLGWRKPGTAVLADGVA